MNNPTPPNSAPVPEEWARAARSGRPEATVHGLFAEVARRQPDARALAWTTGKMTYGELERLSTALAHRLIASGVSRETAVGLFMQRSPEAIVGMLAVLKAGATYVPLDPEYPRARIGFLLGDAGVGHVLTMARWRDRLEGFDVHSIDIADATPVAAAATELPATSPGTRAYVMYTSGSTGTPKGVQIEHRCIVRLVAEVDYVKLEPATCFLNAAPLGFDAATLEIWGPLLNGGSVAIFEDAMPSGPALATMIERHGVNAAWLTAGLFNAIVDTGAQQLRGLGQLLIGGEALSAPHVRRAQAVLPDTQIINGYGPTECTTFAATWPIPASLGADCASVPIGRPIAGTHLLVLDAQQRAVARGEAGELYIGGAGVARGYLSRPELDRERFVSLAGQPDGRYYRTGDLVRWSADGALEFIGRVDQQVKIRGYRIELGEIESRLSALPGVTACAVAVHGEDAASRRLVAYYVAEGAMQAETLRAGLAACMPEFMVPAHFIALEKLPVTANGKLDRRALPAPSSQRPALQQHFEAPNPGIEAAIAGIFSDVLGVRPVGRSDAFFELGGTSLQVLGVLQRMQALKLGDPGVAAFFAAPTPAGLAATLSGKPAQAVAARQRPRAVHDEQIAIVGMAGRFPGAPDIETFWRNLCEGRESIRFFGRDELDPSIPAAQRADRDYVPARGVLDGVENFDAAFFGISPLEAQLMDPQHRHFLEVAWHALEHAGHAPQDRGHVVGVFGGMYNASYFQRHLMARPDVTGRMGELQVMLGNEKDYLTSRVAHKLGLDGPAVSVNTACSTSLVATVMAMEALRSGQCDIALAGGVAITCPPASGYLYQEGSMASRDGHTRTFDSSAAGTVFSDGAGIVVLRRLRDALADGNTVYAVLLGGAVNNDGSQRASFTAPSPEGQAAVIAAAHDSAGISARSISYVEAHGTATPLGDPVEVDGLTRAFRRHTDDTGFCGIGSLKSNVGHTVIAAGVAGLIKTALSLHREQIPPTINFRSPNPQIDFARSPFHVQTTLAAWPRTDVARRAAVSSFGFGGTNAHVILQEAPPAAESSASTRRAQLLLLSARDDLALSAATTRLCGALRDRQDNAGWFADAAHTLRVGRKALARRRFVVAEDAADAQRRLQSTSDALAPPARDVAGAPPRIVFLFPGQGSQYAAMGRALHAEEPAFRAAWDAACAALERHGFERARERLFDEDPAALTPTSVTQPALFCFSFALATLWMSWGIRPAAMAGHSVGEFVAAVLAGVMSLEDAAGLVAERGRLMQAQPAGSMLSVRLPVADLAARLPEGVVIAAENGPALCVASGPTPAIAALEEALGASGVACRRLVTSHAFHSPMMDAVVEPLARRLAGISLHAPGIPVMSTVHADWLTAEQARDATYWAEHLRRPVRFGPAVARLAADPSHLFIEMGPRATLATLTQQIAAEAGGRQGRLPAISCGADAPERESAQLALSAGRAWSFGVDFDWPAYRSDESRRRVALPGYPFQPVRHWVDAPVASAGKATTVPPVALAQAVPAQVASASQSAPVAAAPTIAAPDMKDLVRRVQELIEEVSGHDVSDAEPSTPWLDLGLDSLALTQLALQVQRALGVKVSFRQIMEDYPSVAELAAMLAARQAPAEAAQPQVTPQATASVDAIPAPAPASDEEKGGAATYDVKKAFGAIARIHTRVDELTPLQRARLDAFVARYTARTAKSKAYTAEYRRQMADPRVVNGFRPLTKELTYQLVVERSRGSRLWDIDGNEYIDVLQGFGMSMFGWQPDFIREAVHAQVDLGYEIGPQHKLAGETARLFCEVTGAERAAFCNTGSEAVMGAMRVARTVTGRSTVAIFTGAYHGIFDEVIVRGTRKLRTIPAAPGIMPESSQNMLVLDYGTPESLEILRQRADTLAAIVVEPVQSRRPDFAPVEFLRELRKLTEEHGIVFIFDEVVTGFRSHPRGAQGLFGIEADLASYGKVVGGGFSIGVIAGKARFMDALDGGQWQYGDASIPTVGVTYFAGTFVRHPLALAASRAALQHMKDAGGALQERLTSRTRGMVDRVNADMASMGAPFRLHTFASLWRNVFTEDLPYGDLIYAMLRDRGIHILDNFPCFLTTAHSEADIDAIVTAYREAAREMQASGFFPVRSATKAAQVVDGRRAVPTTEPQREVWLADSAGPSASLAYNESITLHLRGNLRREDFLIAVQSLLRRHDALRSTFSADGGSLLVPAPESAPVCTVTDVSGDATPAARLQEIADRHVREPFTLATGPLVRAELVCLAPGHHALVLTGHHIVLDGWSFWVLIRELAALYRGDALPVAPSFADYAVQAERSAHSDEATACVNWWVQQFPDGGPTLSLPADRPRPRRRTQASGRVDHDLPVALVSQARALGSASKASLFATLLSAFAGVLSRVSGQDDLVIGIPSAGQASDGVDGLVGHCVNILPLRFAVDRAAPFTDLLARGRRVMFDAYDHQSVTFGRLLQALPVHRDPSRLPLVSVLFNIDQAMSGESMAMPGLQTQFLSNPRVAETFELFVNAVDLGHDGMRLECQYNSDLFDGDTVKRWLGAYQKLLECVVGAPQAAVGSHSLLDSADRKLLAAWNRSEMPVPTGRRIEQLIHERITEEPGRVAVRTFNGDLTYADVGRHAATIRAHLAQLGVRPGDRIGLLLDRDRWMIPALVATLAAGACYVPLEPSFPAERLLDMAEDAGLSVVVASAAVAGQHGSLLSGRRVLLLDDSIEQSTLAAPVPGPLSDADDAYVIYTSGSTGRPKGVRVQHSAVVNFLESMRREPGLQHGNVLMAVTTLAFDIAVTELILPLVVGATIILVRREEAHAGDRLADLIARFNVDTLQATPATWRLLIDTGWAGGAGFRALCGGEPLPPDLAGQLLDRVGQLWNMYGPTETTVWSALHRVTAGEQQIPIGRPLANTTLHVIEPEGTLAPIGVVGELYIGGAGVTRGYLHRDDLTAERFVPDRATDVLCDDQLPRSSLLYRTGDLARWRNDGTLECLGRTDFQVKLRGFRIELGEIEVALARLQGIRQAVVVVREDRPGDRRLVAYVVAAGQCPGADAMRESLQASLPDYMVPRQFVVLESMPLTGSGKVDRRALPVPEADRSIEDDREPETPGERLAARHFCQTLAVPRVGASSDFFSLGGHSLLAAQMSTRLAAETGRAVPMSIIFERSTVAALGRWLDEFQQAGPTAAGGQIQPRVDSSDPVPLSLMQQRVWYVEQLQPGTAQFSVPSAHRLRGVLEAAAMERALAKMAARQSALRTVVREIDAEPVQVVLDGIDVKVDVEDLTGLAESARETRLQQRLAVEAARPLDVHRAPLFRAKLFRLGAEEHVFFFMAHHLIWDGWSFDLFYEEMAELYAAECEGRAARLPALPVSYADFSAWHRGWMKGEVLERQVAYWRERLMGAPESLQLPVDRPRPAMQSGDGGTVWVHVPSEPIERLRAVAQSESGTLFMTLLTLWALVLHRQTGQREVVIGTPVRGRSQPETEKLMGFFVNAIPLRVAIPTDGGFRDALRSVRRQVVEAFGFQDVPFEHLVRVLGSSRDQSRFPIYQTFFSYQDARGRTDHWGPLRHRNVPVFQPAAAQDIALWFLDGTDGLVGGLNYNSDILEPGTVERIRATFLEMLERVADEPSVSLDVLLRPGAAELAQLQAWNDTDAPLPDIGLAQYLDVARRDADVVIRSGALDWSAADLERACNAVAVRLQASGVKRGDVVAVRLQRGPALVSALLGVLRAGAGYLPMDPDFPDDRLRYMLEDSGAAVLLTDEPDTLKAPPGVAVLDMQATMSGESVDPGALARLPQASGADLAYLLYTSGSTGKPKGVRVPQRAVVNFLESMRRAPGVDAGSRLAAVTTVSFDISVLELFLPLAAGGTVVLVSREQATDGHALRALLEKEGIAMMQATPATWRLLIEAGWRGGASFRALCGGEALPEDLAEALLERVGELWNMYGPTETTVWSTCERILPGQGSIGIGRPIGNTQVWIMDDAGALQPIGVPGEICIGGEGVADGYHRRPELTAARFVPDSISGRDGARLYRTGDLGRWTAEGRLQHLGRSDFQVKLRGYRIELGEIETVLLRDPRVSQCVVVALGKAEQARLVAYFVSQSQASLDTAALRDALRRELPDYMVPAQFVSLQRLPLTPNGKIDRAALPVPEAAGAVSQVDAAAEAGLTSTERQLVSLWSELLGVSGIRSSDNFLDLGGHSLMIMRAVARVEALTGIRLSPRGFVFQTLAQIAAEIDAGSTQPMQVLVEPAAEPSGLLQRVARLFSRPGR